MITLLLTAGVIIACIWDQVVTSRRRQAGFKRSTNTQSNVRVIACLTLFLAIIPACNKQVGKSYAGSSMSHYDEDVAAGRRPPITFNNIMKGNL